MSQKWHTGPNGPGICKAKSGNCPFGGEESHYETREEAQAKFDVLQEEKHGLLPADKGTEIDESDFPFNDNLEDFVDTFVEVEYDNGNKYFKGIVGDIYAGRNPGLIIRTEDGEYKHIKTHRITSIISYDLDLEWHEGDADVYQFSDNDNVVGPTMESAGGWYKENAPLYEVYKKEFGVGSVYEVSEGKHSPLDYSINALNDYPGSYITDARETVSRDLNSEQKAKIFDEKNNDYTPEFKEAYAEHLREFETPKKKLFGKTLIGTNFDFDSGTRDFMVKFITKE